MLMLTITVKQKLTAIRQNAQHINTIRPQHASPLIGCKLTILVIQQHYRLFVLRPYSIQFRSKMMVWSGLPNNWNPQNLTISRPPACRSKSSCSAKFLACYDYEYKNTLCVSKQHWLHKHQTCIRNAICPCVLANYVGALSKPTRIPVKSLG